MIVSLIFLLKSFTHKESLSVLFIGNSITKHGPSDKVGWTGNYGMAATSKDKDYVHVLLELLNDKISINDYKVLNVAGWERNFFIEKSLYNLENSFNPDVIIVRLGENINEEYAEKNNFKLELKNLIEHFDTKGKAHIIITNTFWPRPYLNQTLYKLANEKHYQFADISDLWNDQSNAAFGKFNNIFVQRHPSDKGMHEIARRIFEAYIRKGKTD